MAEEEDVADGAKAELGIVMLKAGPVHIHDEAGPGVAQSLPAVNAVQKQDMTQFLLNTIIFKKTASEIRMYRETVQVILPCLTFLVDISK